MKKTVNAFDYAGDICKAMKKGILVTIKNGEKVNPMTIGWGTVGIEWGKPIFIAFIRPSRYTHEMIEMTGEFTVNIPMTDSDPGISKILGYCGSKSGRDVDKVKELDLSLVESDVVAAPGFKELPLTLECKVLYKQDQVVGNIPDALRDRYYPDPSNLNDYHTAYYAEIVNAYMICDSF